MVDKILNELKDELNVLAKCKDNSYVVIGLNTKFAMMNNIVKADEILISEDEILIQSGHLHMTFELDDNMTVTKYDGVESEYYINNDDTELYINLLGT